MIKKQTAQKIRRQVSVFGQTLLNTANLLPIKGPRKKLRDPILEEIGRILLIQIGQPRKAKHLKVYWYPRLRTTAGLAYLQSNTICLNPKLVSISSSEVQRTLRHELAHLVGGGEHGPKWHKACTALGIPDEKATHSLPLKIKIKRPYLYACPVCNNKIKRVKPISKPCACIKCCKKHNNGKYKAKFRFRLVEINP